MSKVILTLICFLLFLTSTLAQRRNEKGQNKRKNAAPTENNKTELDKSSQEYIRLTEEYKKSLEQLLALYKKDVQRAEERLAKMRELYTQGIITNKKEIDDSERAVADARAKVAEAEKLIQLSEVELAKAYGVRNSLLPKTYEQKPFDLSLQKLPVNYYGIDERTLLTGLLKRKEVEKKGEFETTEQYRQRLKQEQSKPLAGNLLIDSLMAASYEVIQAAYDADQQLMSVSLPMPRATKSGIIFGNHQSIIISDRLKMDIPIARSTKPYLRALLVFQLEPPYLSEYNQINAKLLEVWFYNIVTGKVHSKIKVRDALAGVEKEKEKEKEEEKRTVNLTPKELLAKARELYTEERDLEALRMLRRVLVVEPMNAEAYLLIGRIYLRQRDQEQAISALKTAVFWDAKLIDAHILLARIFLERGDRAMALVHVRNALQIDPDNQEAVNLEKQIHLKVLSMLTRRNH